MKFYFLFTLCILLCFNVNAQYLLYNTSIECKSDDKAMIEKAATKLKLALQEMVKEDRLMNFDAMSKIEKEKFNLEYYFSIENDLKFKEVLSEWKKRSEKNDPSLFKSFWAACPVRKDTLMNAAKVTFPYLKNMWAPVAVVEGIDENPDPALDYKMVFDFTAFPSVEGKDYKVDSAAANWALGDIGRIFNLHVASGIPKEKIFFVVAVHGFATQSFFTNEAYQEKYKTNNPNLPIIEELSKAGIKFLVCGQSMSWMKYSKNMLVPQARVALTAQTVLSSYQMKGYGLKAVSNE